MHSNAHYYKQYETYGIAQLRLWKVLKQVADHNICHSTFHEYRKVPLVDIISGLNLGKVID